MAFKFVVICTFLATANAGVTLTSTSDNTYRSQGNLASISTQSKSIETPYSSSSKSEIRVTNPSFHSVTATPVVSTYSTPSPVYTKTVQQSGYNYQAPLSYALNNYQQSYVQPAHSEQYYAAPVVAKTYQQYQPAYQQAYQPAYHVAQPAQVYTSAQVAPVAPIYAAPMHYASPVVQHAPVVQHSYASAPVVKVAYSPASEVAHLTYSNANDHVSYGW